jgi:serine/threonine protein kinase
MPRASDADGNDDMMTDVTNAMGVIQLPDDHAQVAAAAAASKRRPLDAVAEAGQPAPPIPFDRPKFQRGRRADVVCYIEETQSHSVAKNVLFRDYSREFGDVDGALNRVTQAYWPLPFKDRISTIMGHVEICLVLTKCASEQSDDSSTSSDDESFEEEEIVFQVTNRYVAVKVNYSQQMEKLRNKHAEDPLKEIAAMQLIGNDHPNVMGPIEVLFDGQNLDVVMPYAGSGDLFQLLQESQQNSVGFSEPTARYWFRQVMAGIKHLHDKGICHRDISPENVMIDNDGCLIIDMGMALRIPYTDPNAANSVTDITRGSHRRLIRPQGACGKLPYMSPEVCYINIDDAGDVPCSIPSLTIDYCPF